MSRRVAWLVCLVLTGSSMAVVGPTPARAVGSADSAVAASSVPPEGSGELVLSGDGGLARRSELVGMRTATSRTYATDVAGVLKTVAWPSPVHFLDETGRWRSYDTDLEPAGAGVVATQRTALATEIATDLEASELVSVSPGAGVSVGFGLADGSPASNGIVVGDEVSFDGALPGADLRLRAVPSGVKEEIVVESAAADLDALEFPLALEGVVARLDAAGGVEYVDSAGTVRAVTPPGFMVDGAEDPVRSDAVRFDLQGPPGQQVLHVDVDREWMADPARVFPVVVDPTFEFPFEELAPDQDDTYMVEGAPGDRTDLPELQVGLSGGAVRRSLLRFSTLDHPDFDGASVFDARLVLTQNDGGACPSAPPFAAYRVPQVWPPEGTESITYPGPTDVDPPDEDRLAVSESWASYGTGSGCTPSGEVAVHITRAAWGWTGGTWANFGVMLRAVDEEDPDGFRQFASADAEEPTERPRLELVWSNPAFGPTDQPAAPVGVAPAGELHLESPIPTGPSVPMELSAEFADPEDEDGHVQFFGYSAETFAWGTVFGDVVSSEDRSETSGGSLPYDLPLVLRSHAVEGPLPTGLPDPDNLPAVSALSDPVNLVIPSVQLVAPTNGASVYGIATLRAEVADTSGLDRVEFRVDGQLAGTDTTAPFELTGDSTLTPGGPDHGLDVRAVYTNGRVVFSPPIDVTVNNGLRVTSHSDGDTVFHTETVHAWRGSTPANEVDSIELLIDDTPTGVFADAAGDIAWDTAALGDGPHTVAVQLTTTGQQVFESPAVPVEVANELDASARISADRERGLLNADSQMVEGVTMIAAPDAGSERYLAGGVGDDGTTLLLRYLSRYQRASTASQAAVDGLLAPSGALETGCDATWCVAEFAAEGLPAVQIQYRPDQTNDTDGNTNNIPDVVEATASLIHSTIPVYENLGFDLHPDYHDGKKITITARDLFPTSWVDPTSDHIFLTALDGEEPLDETQHELFHLFQYNYLSFRDVVNGYCHILDHCRWSTLWWMEATANWATYEAAEPPQADQIPYYARSLQSFLASPWERLAEPSAVGNNAGYGEFLFAEHLDQTYDHGAMVEVFEELKQGDGRHAIEVLEDVQDARSDGVSWEDFVAGFWRTAYTFEGFDPDDAETWRTVVLDDLTGTDNDSFGRQRPARQRIDLSASAPTGSAQVALNPGGAAFIDIRPAADELGRVQIEAQVDDSSRVGKYRFEVIGYDEAGNPDHPDVCATPNDDLGFPEGAQAANQADGWVGDYFTTSHCPTATLVISQIDPNGGSNVDQIDVTVDFDDARQILFAATVVGHNQDRPHQIVEGTGASIGDGGSAQNDPVSFTPSGPVALAIEHETVQGGGTEEAQALYVGDHGRIRRIGRQNVITTVVGTGYPGSSGEGGPATQAQIPSPTAIAIDGTGQLVFATATAVYRVEQGDLIRIAGHPTTPGFTGDGGTGTDARFDQISDLEVGGAGNIFVADTNNHRIRMIDTDGNVSTIAGDGFNIHYGDGGPATSASLAAPTGIALDSGEVVVAENAHLRTFSVGGSIDTIAGNGTVGVTHSGALATDAAIAPRDVEIDAAGQIVMTTGPFDSVRVIAASGRIYTVAGHHDTTTPANPEDVNDGERAPLAIVANARGLATGIEGTTTSTAGNIYFIDLNNYRLRIAYPGGT